MASLLVSMANIKSPQEVSTQLLLYFLVLRLISRARDFLSQIHVELPKELLVRGWDAKTVVHVLHQLDPNLSFTEVFNCFDSLSFHVDSSSAFTFLDEAFLEATGSHISDLLKKRWKVPSHSISCFSFIGACLSLVRNLLAAPSTCCSSLSRCSLLTNLQENSISADSIVWTYQEMIDTIISLLESSVFDEAKTLLAPIMKANPTIILINLFTSSIRSYMRRFLIEQLCLRVLCSPLDSELIVPLHQGIQINLSLVLEVLELFIRSHDDVPNRLLLNINQLHLQALLLQSNSHFVFNQLFVKNWTRDNQLSQALQERIDQYSFPVVMGSMVTFIKSHCKNVTSTACRPLLSLLCMLEERCVQQQDDTTHATVREAIQTIRESSSAMKKTWMTMIQAETQKLNSILNQPNRVNVVNQLCTKIVELRSSKLIFDHEVYISFISVLLGSLTAPTAILSITLLGELFERRLFEGDENSILVQVITTLKQINDYDLASQILQGLLPYLRDIIHDRPEIEEQLQTIPCYQDFRMKSVMNPSPSIGISSPPPGLRTPIMNVSSLTHQIDSNEPQDIQHCPPLSEAIQGKLTRLMNQLSPDNYEKIAEKIKDLIPVSSYPAFANVMASYISRQSLHGHTYFKLITALHSQELEEYVLDSCIYNAKICFQDADNENTHQKARSLGEFIALLTVTRNHALPIPKLDLKKLLYEAHMKNILGNVMPFVCAIVKGCASSDVLKSPSQPWVHMMLVELCRIHNDQTIPSSCKLRYVPIVFDAFSLSEEQRQAIFVESQSSFQQSINHTPSLHAIPFSERSASMHSRASSNILQTPQFTAPGMSPASTQLKRSVSYSQPPSLFSPSVQSLSPSLSSMRPTYLPSSMGSSFENGNSSLHTTFQEGQDTVLNNLRVDAYSMDSRRQAHMTSQSLLIGFRQHVESYVYHLQQSISNGLVSSTQLPDDVKFAKDLDSFFKSSLLSSDINPDPYYAILCRFLYSTFIKENNQLKLRLYQLIVPVVLNVAQRCFGWTPASLIEYVLQTLFSHSVTNIDINFIGTIIQKKLISASHLDPILCNVLHATPADQLENASITVVLTDLIRQLMINRHVLYTNNLPKTIRAAAELSASAPANSHLEELHSVLLQLQHRYEVLVQETVFMNQFRSVLHAWIDLGVQPTENQVISFILALKRRGLFQSETQTVVALRLLLLSALNISSTDQTISEEVSTEIQFSKDEFSSAVHAFTTLVLALYRYTHGASKSGLLLCIMTSIASVLTDDQKDGTQHSNSLVLSMLLEIIETVLEPFHTTFIDSQVSPSQTALATDILRVLLYGLQRMQPSILPIYTYAWVTAMSSLSLIRLAKQCADETVANQYTELIVAYLRFLNIFWTTWRVLPKSIEIHAKALASLLLTLYNEWPALLSAHYAQLCLYIPSCFPQLRNTITAAQPGNLPFFDPRGAISGELTKYLHMPTVDKWDTHVILKPLKLEKYFSEYGSNNGVIAKLSSIALQYANSPEIFNAIIYEVAESTYIQYDNSQRAFPVEFYTNVLKMLNVEDLRNAIFSLLDHIRYPSLDTYYFCMLVKTIIDNNNKNDVKQLLGENIMICLGERLLVTGPKPWGLEFLFSQILNATTGIKEQSFMTGYPMKKLVEKYAK